MVNWADGFGCAREEESTRDREAKTYNTHDAEDPNMTSK